MSNEEQYNQDMIISAWKALVLSAKSRSQLMALLANVPPGADPSIVATALALLSLLEKLARIDQPEIKMQLDQRDWYKEMQEHLEVLGGNAEYISKLLHLLAKGDGQPPDTFPKPGSHN